MKKSRLNIVITMLFVILMAICLFACGGNNNNSPSKGNENKNTEKEKFRVTFIADDREISSQQYDVGTTQITVPSVPTKDNYNGVWEEYTINTTKKVDLTIRAIYTPIQYSAIYYVNKSDTPYITIHFDVENSIETQPVYQTEEGEVFGGWYYNNSIAALGVEKVEGIININNSYIDKETKTIKIYAGTYQGTPGFEFKYNNGKYLVNAYKGHDDDIILPETYNNTPVQGIQFDNNTSYNFRGKTNINSVVIPNTYTSIQAGLFNGCTNLKKLSTPFVCSEEEPNSQSETIPYLKWIGSFKNLEEIYIDHGIIRQDEFWEQENLKKVTINEAQMNQSAFYGLQNLEQVTILGEVSISQNAFYNCVKLKTISIENITRIGQNAFANCVKLEKVTIPNTATIVDTNAFKNCTSLEELNIAAKTIGEGIIQGCNIESITLLAGVENISENAFINTSKLKEVVFPLTLKTIQNNAFKDSGIEQIDLSNTILESIGESAFENCVNCKYLMLPANTTFNVAAKAFANCNNLREIWNYSNKQLTIGSKNDGSIAFYAINIYTTECESQIQTMNFNGAQIEYIINGTDYYLTSYINDNITNSITFPDIILDHTYAFANGRIINTDLTGKENLSLVLSTNIKDIKEENFANLSQITSISNYAQLETIGERAFYSCGIETNLTLSNIKTIGSEAFYGNKFEEVVLSDLITIIEGQTFANCTNLENITLGNSIVSIGNSAFMGTKLASIDIPNTVTTIYDNAFACNTLSEITLNANSKLVNVNKAFNGSYGDVVINLNDWDDWAQINFVKALNSRITNTNIIYNSNSVVFKVGGISSLDVVLDKEELMIGSFAFYGLDTLNSLTIESDIDGVFFSEGSFRGVSINTLYVKDFANLVSLSYNENIYLDGPVAHCRAITIYNETSLDYDIEILKNNILTIDSFEYIGKYAFAGLPQATTFIILNVETIDEYAFYNSANGTTINLTNVDLINFDAFTSGETQFTVNTSDEYDCINRDNRVPQINDIEVWISNGFKLTKK